jgi:ribosomal protein S18 acetylase RimI-like enzyme
LRGIETGLVGRQSSLRRELSQTQPAMKSSPVHPLGGGAYLGCMSQLHHEQSPLPASIPIPPLASQREPQSAGQTDDAGEDRTVVFTRPLNENEWGMIRAFVAKTDREDLRLRFGQSLDFADAATLKRFFDIGGDGGELVCMLDEAGDITGILQRVLTSPSEAEIALIVRSDRQRMGIGEKLLRTALSRAIGQNLKTLRALVLHENGAMLRLARKFGLASRKPSGFSVELELDLRPGGTSTVQYEPQRGMAREIAN